MANVSDMLGKLMSGGGADLLEKARETWGNQSAGTQGAVAGGLLAVFLGAGRGGLGSVVKVGAAAAIGSVASRAYADYKAGKPPLEAINDAIGLPEGMLSGEAAPGGDRAERLLRAMLAAARADGTVSDAERARITGQMETLGFPEDARALIEEALAAPADPARIAALARDDEEATQIYTASLLVVDPEAPAEKAWLATLASALKLEPALVAQLHAHAGNLMLRA